MMLDPDTLVLLQSADAFESMRDHQLARAAAEPEYEEEDIPGPSPTLWSSSSLLPMLTVLRCCALMCEQTAVCSELMQRESCFKGWHHMSGGTVEQHLDIKRLLLISYLFFAITRKR